VATALLVAGSTVDALNLRHKNARKIAKGDA